jgi:osmotically-inducible protein OsmY
MLLMTLFLQGCTMLAVSGAAVTASAVHDRRTLGVYVEDQSIAFKADGKLIKDKEIDQQCRINVTSYNMVALMTGQCPNEQLRSRAESTVSNVERVRRVVNELQIDTMATLGDRTSSAALVAEVKFKLTDIDLPDFDALRVKVVAEKNTVYLMGLVTKEEGDAVTELVRYIGGVDRVVKVFEYF